MNLVSVATLATTATPSNHGACSRCLLIREVATKATHIFISIEHLILSVAVLKKRLQVAKKYQLNQWCYRCCLVARVFEISQGNYRGVVSFVMRTLPDCLLAVPHPPFWQALFALLTFSQPWGLGSTSSPCTPTAQWRA